MTRVIAAVLAAAGALGAQTYDIVLKGGHVIDPKNRVNAVMDVAIAGGRIARVAPSIPAEQSRKTVDVRGLKVVPGLIDIHVHVFPRPENRDIDRDSNVQADAHSFPNGVTTVVDAGTAGWRLFPEFKRRVIDKAQTRVLAFLNISGWGMGLNKEDDLNELDAEAAAKMAKEHRSVIVGFKTAHFAGPGWESLDAAVKAGNDARMPVMIDFGYLNAVRNLPTLLMDKLRPGDIYTHCYSGHREEVLPDGKINPTMFLARKRGVLFDVGFGAGSFYWYVAVPAMEQGLPPDTISTDLHTGSMNAGMKTMTNAMSSVLNLGATLDQVIAMSTENPARHIQRPDLGHLDTQAEADIAVLRVDKGQFGFLDSAGASMPGKERIVAELTLRNGRVVWDLNGRAAEGWKTFKYDRKKWTK